MDEIIRETIVELFDKVKELSKDEVIKALNHEIDMLKAENEALKQDKIYSSDIKPYASLEDGKERIYFDQKELDTYLKCIYRNVKGKTISPFLKEITNKTGMDYNLARAIRTKLIKDGILRVQGSKTYIVSLEKELEEKKENNETELIDYDWD